MITNSGLNPFRGRKAAVPHCNQNSSEVLPFARGNRVMELGKGLDLFCLLLNLLSEPVDLGCSKKIGGFIFHRLYKSLSNLYSERESV